ncbi:MAG: MBOAT family protein [Parcubacteria group bacterium CG_4_10_14_0_2_um_filter_7_35_8]|nr:MAG: MBOAT family protein [Parcubacteria group bacterium CG_4_10_14_0_2_um_filter_7_35_8]
MLFPTFSFFVFFSIVLILNWFLKRKPFLWRIFLLAISYLFYATWDIRFLALIFLVSIFNYLGTFFIDWTINKSYRKFWLTLIIGVDVLVLVFFKYFNFFRESADILLNKIGFSSNALLLHIILPIGLSFYILRAISYSVDVFNKKISLEKSFLDLAIYISFFPQLLSGPILRAKDFFIQLKDGGAKTIENLEENFTLILIGLFKKIVIASYLTVNIVDDVFTVPQNHSQLVVLLAIYAFAIVIYCDFSGYSDMAIGIAGLMGFKSPNNFASPYLAVDFQDFWRRWHITLSNWLRDYIYIPLGGNRKGEARTYLNLMATMFISGLWHGTGIQFVVWSIFHGLALIISRFKAEIMNQGVTLEKILSWFITLNAVCFLWIFFRAQNLQNAFDIIKQLFNWQSLREPINVYIIILIFLSFLLFIFEQEIKEILISIQKRLSLFSMIIFLTIIVILIIKLGPNIVPPFIYFKF